MIVKDTNRFVKDTKRKERALSPIRSCSHSSSVRSTSSKRLLSRSVTPRTSVTSYPPPKSIPEVEKRVYTSKECLVYLFDVWQPQLTKSYRPNVQYTPTDPRVMRTLMMSSTERSRRLDRFRAVERMVETVNQFNLQKGLESRMSHGQIKG